MPTVPFAATLTVGVNACWSCSGVEVGIWLIFTRPGQVKPPSVDCENMIASIPGRSYLVAARLPAAARSRDANGSTAHPSHMFEALALAVRSSPTRGEGSDQ